MTKSPAIWAFLSIALAAFLAPVKAESPCQPIRFKAGRFSTTVRGTAPVEGVICYTLATGAGQIATVRIKVIGRVGAVAFNIFDVVENQDAYQFRTERKTYRIDVYVFPKAARGIPFAMSVSVR